MAERNGHHLWARAFRFQTAWLLTHVGDFARARALCERERQPGEEVQLGEILGSIVLGFADARVEPVPRSPARIRRGHRPVGERTGPDGLDPPHAAAAGTGSSTGSRAGSSGGPAKRCRSCVGSPPPRASGRTSRSVTKASPRRLLARATGPRPNARWPRPSACSTDSRRRWRSGESAPRPRVSRTARGRRSRAEAYWGRGAAVLDRLATCLKDDGDLYRSFLAQPAVEAVRRNAKLTADTAPPQGPGLPAASAGAPARPTALSVCLSSAAAGPSGLGRPRRRSGGPRGARRSSRSPSTPPADPQPADRRAALLREVTAARQRLWCERRVRSPDEPRRPAVEIAIRPTPAPFQPDPDSGDPSFLTRFLPKPYAVLMTGPHGFPTLDVECNDQREPE